MEEEGLAGKVSEPRICETCHEKKTITPRHRECASCMAKKANKSKTEKSGTPETDQAARKPEEPSPGMGGEQKSDQRADLTLTLDFSGKHARLLEDINKLAEEEMRPVEWQVFYILRSHIKGISS
jgi:hypothetical protein